MALVQKRNTKRTVTLLAVMGVIIVGGLILYFTWLAPPAGTPTTQTDLTQRDLPIVSDFGEQISNDPRYQSLEPFGDLPVNIGQTGRDNPFEPPIL